MTHKHYCAIDDLGLCTCGLFGMAVYGPWGLPVPEPTPKILSDAEAVQSLVDVDHLASVQDRVEKLRKKGIVLCRVS